MTNPESIRLRLEDLPAELRSADDASPLPSAKTPSVTLSGIEDHPDGVAELADVLNEVAPTLGLHSYPKATPPRTPGTDSHRWQTAHANVLLRERLRNAVPMPSGPNQIDWSALTATITSEMLASEELTAEGTPSPEPSHPRAAPPPTTPGGSLVEVNSGGRVLFCLFELDEEAAAAAAVAAGRVPGSTPAEGCLVVKFNRTRLLCQSEQFANELARHVGICSPDSRILRAAGGDGEWAAALAAAERLSGIYPELLEEMIQCGSLLLMEYIPGKGLFRTASAFDLGALPYTFEDLGRLFALDLVLGNPDRLKCDALGWRGNSENVLWASAGRWQGRLVAIDAVVQRRPPGALLSAEYAAAEQVVELTLNNAEVAASALAEALSMSPAALDAMTADPSAAVEAFQRGLRRGLEAMMGLKGLLEMMFDVVADWIHDFIEDINGVATPDTVSTNNGNGTAPMSARRSGSTSSTPLTGLCPSLAEGAAEDTFKIRRINAEAAHNRSVGEKVSEWKAAFRAKGEDLRAAVEEWQAKRGSGKPLVPPATLGIDSGSDDSEEVTTPRIGTGISSPRPAPQLSPAPSLGGADFASPRSAATASGVKLTTGFLDGTHPVVDVYELKVRLEHMLRRLRVLQQASATAAPTALLPDLYLSGAVEASSLHILRHCGITHVLNCTEDLLLPEETQSFTGMRIPLRDVEEEDITPYFAPAAEFIDAAMEGGGKVLVHCHAGRSRSCSLVLAWLMTRRRWPLRRALEFLQERRPEAAPNAGYMQQLAALEGELFGTQTVKVKKTKPEPKRCPECGEKIGLSAESVRVHIRLKHPSKAAALLSSPVKGSGSFGERRASVDRAESADV